VFAQPTDPSRLHDMGTSMGCLDSPAAPQGRQGVPLSTYLHSSPQSHRLLKRACDQLIRLAITLALPVHCAVAWIRLHRRYTPTPGKRAHMTAFTQPPPSRSAQQRRGLRRRSGRVTTHELRVPCLQRVVARASLLRCVSEEPDASTSLWTQKMLFPTNPVEPSLASTFIPELSHLAGLASTSAPLKGPPT
jgi:hypothetical protein